MNPPFLTHNRFAERLRPDDAALVIIDAQAGLIDRFGGERAPALRNNVEGLARLAHFHGLPTIVGASAPDGPHGPVLDELRRLFGAQRIISRAGGAFFDDSRARDAVLNLGRRHLLLAAFAATEGVAGPAIAAARAGFEVHAVMDASLLGDDRAMLIGQSDMAAAGIAMTTWVALLAEFAASAAGDAATAPVEENLACYAPLWRGERFDPPYSLAEADPLD